MWSKSKSSLDNVTSCVFKHSIITLPWQTMTRFLKYHHIKLDTHKQYSDLQSCLLYRQIESHIPSLSVNSGIWAYRPHTSRAVEKYSKLNPKYISHITSCSYRCTCLLAHHTRLLQCKAICQLQTLTRLTLTLRDSIYVWVDLNIS